MRLRHTSLRATQQPAHTHIATTQPLTKQHLRHFCFARTRRSPTSKKMSASKETMMAIAVANGKGPASALHLVPIPRPQPAQGEVLINVKAAGLNRADLLQREGKYPPPPGAPDTLGLEIAGEVVEGAGRWKRGDKVCALLGGGGYAEYVVCDARHALPLPSTTDFTLAAALPEAAFTVWANVFEAGQLKKGEVFLLHGATSGIGTVAIQMARAAGAKVITTSRGKDKAEQARQMGVDVSIDVTSQEFVGIVQKEGGADVILDMVGAPYFAKNLDALKMRGRIVYIAAQGEDKIEASIGAIMRKQAVVTGSTLRSRNADEKARLAAEVEKHVWPWVEQSLVKPPIEKAFPLREAAAAHEHLEKGTHLGKIVLLP